MGLCLYIKNQLKKDKFEVPPQGPVFACRPALRSRQNHVFLFIFRRFLVISAMKSLKKLWNEQKRLKRGRKKGFDQLLGARSTQKLIKIHNTTNLCKNMHIAFTSAFQTETSACRHTIIALFHAWKSSYSQLFDWEVPDSGSEALLHPMSQAYFEASASFHQLAQASCREIDHVYQTRIINKYFLEYIDGPQSVPVIFWVQLSQIIRL